MSTHPLDQPAEIATLRQMVAELEQRLVTVSRERDVARENMSWLRRILLTEDCGACDVLALDGYHEGCISHRDYMAERKTKDKRATKIEQAARAVTQLGWEGFRGFVEVHENPHDFARLWDSLVAALESA